MPSSIERDAKRHAQLILKGVVLAIDPASGGTSRPGFAVFKDGELIGSGTIAIPKGSIQERLAYLYGKLSKKSPDVLVVERIRGTRAHVYLHWAVGVSVAATNPPIVLEMPVSTWKKHVGKAHKKGDEADAVAIGQTLLALASPAA